MAKYSSSAFSIGEARIAQEQYFVQQVSGAAAPCLADFRTLAKDKPNSSKLVAKLPENRLKNRYTDVLPYDDTRVRLMGVADYINADHVRKSVGGHDYWYLCSQGPLDATLNDFWRMVWEQNVRIIVMVTNLYEAGKVKCAMYWPSTEGDQGAVNFGNLRVTLMQVQQYNEYDCRAFQIRDRQTGEKRAVWQLHYTNWPDHGVPTDPAHFLDFYDRLQVTRRHVPWVMPSPVVVHCSAGIGRTGVLVMVDLLLALLDTGVVGINPATILAELREQRSGMIQTPDQYLFVHQVALAYLRRSNEAQNGKASTSF